MDHVRYMPYPYHTDHMDYRPNYYPRSEAAPPHMYMTPSRLPVNYEHWPWGSNYGYAYPPVPCHGCCNHSHMPAHYSWRPPYSHVPPAYAPGGYPPFPNECVPPYYVEQPQFVYEKNMPRDHHCCGCPNHLCSQKEQKNVRIEEQEPERELKKEAPVSPFKFRIEEQEPERELKKDTPVSPFKFKNSPYPLMWLPIDSGNEHQKDLKDGSGDVKLPNVQKTDERHPGAWFARYPFGSNKSESPKVKEDNRMSNRESDGKERLPFPLYWMPYMPEEQGKEERKEKQVGGADPKPCLEPVKDSEQQTAGHAISAVKDIPVKEVKSHEENGILHSKERISDPSPRDGKSTSEMLAKDDLKKGASCQPKTSKLPPVCLRVDPLPRRKNTNGKSDSSNPPSDKRRLDQVSSGVRKVPSSTNHEEKPEQVTTKESKEGKGKTRAIKVVDGSTSQEEHSKDQIEVGHNRGKVSTECSRAVEAGRPEDTLSAGEEKGEISSDKHVVAHEVKEPRRPKMSEEEAAVIIQSACRGFVIRKWEPVKKLKRIARVRDKIAEINALIQAVESSSDVQGNDKQRTVIAETIMNLLLELDTIQGLHPSIREVRKSVVRELVNLQEKLDSLVNEKSKASQGQQFAVRCDGKAREETTDVSSQSIKETQPELVEPCLVTRPDGNTFEGTETSEKPAEEPEAISENKRSESCMTEDSEPTLEPMVMDEEQVSQTEAKLVDKEDNEGQVLGQDTKCSVQQNSSPDGMIDCLANGDETSELLKEVADDHCNHLEEEQIRQAGACFVTKGDGEGQVLRQDTVFTSEQNSSSDSNGEEQHEVTKLPEEVSNFQSPSGVGELDLPKQPEEWLREENSSELNKDVPLGEKINLDREFATSEQVENATQSLESANMFESPEVHYETKRSDIEASNGEDNHSNKSLEGLQIMEKDEVMLPVKELDVEQQANKESPEEEVKPGDDILVPDQCSAELTGDDHSLEQEAYDEERSATDPLKNEVNFVHDVENTPEIMSGATMDVSKVDINTDLGLNRNEKPEREEKLMEENERLRDMVEKLVKSGEDQLRVIKNLSGRVKDLEKNLSKKRKLKVKAHKGKRSASLQEWTDGVAV